MAVKVIDPDPDPSVVRRTVCGNCGARLEFVPADIKEHWTRDYTGDSDVRYYVPCPKCNENAYVNRWH
jgi:hypothetical protein